MGKAAVPNVVHPVARLLDNVPQPVVDDLVAVRKVHRVEVLELWKFGTEFGQHIGAVCLVVPERSVQIKEEVRHQKRQK